jgi:2-dehydro-3-deoxygluconokinase
VTAATPLRAAFIGECMIELRHESEDLLRLGFAGDVFNAAAYLARSAAGSAVTVEFVTITGDDPYSGRMREAWRAHGVGDTLAPVLPGGRPGLYLIRLDGNGERTFYHYRRESAARGLFGPGQPGSVDDAIAACDLVYLSAITLSIMTAPARQRLLRTLAMARARGGRVVFDSNFRPSGWASAAQAAAAITETLALTDIGLPTLADEQAVFGDADEVACVSRLRAAGVAEIVVKLGADGCLVAAPDGAAVRVPAVSGVTVVDTTAAGDAFNGAYLAARLRGAPPLAAAQAGNALAAEVVAAPGALLPPPKKTLWSSDQIS